MYFILLFYVFYFNILMLKQRSTLSKQHSTLSKGRQFNAKLDRHCCRFWQQSQTLLRHCCWCWPGFNVNVNVNRGFIKRINAKPLMLYWYIFTRHEQQKAIKETWNIRVINIVHTTSTDFLGHVFSWGQMRVGLIEVHVISIATMSPSCNVFEILILSVIFQNLKRSRDP